MGRTCVEAEPIVVVSPVAAFRTLLSDELEHVGRPFIHAVESIAQALEVASRVNLRLIVVDCTALHARWLSVLGRLRQAAPDARIIVLGDEDEASYEREISHCHGCSYHSKAEPMPTLLSPLISGEEYRGHR